MIAVSIASVSQCRVVAHRGYWDTDGSAQNSLRSLAKADSIGAYASEFDVWMNADGTLVINHDASYDGVVMERATDGQIAALRLANGEAMPTLAQYLSAAAVMPRLHLVLELKQHTDTLAEERAVQRIAAMLNEYGVTGRTDFISFSMPACRAAVRYLPGTDVYYLGGDVDPDTLAQYGLAGPDYSARSLRAHPEWIGRAHALGQKVNVWTVNAPEDMEYFLSRGVDFITTNRPEECMTLTAADDASGK